MADLDDFFKKKDKKKKGEKKFAKANTDVLAKNLEQMAVKEEKAMEKEISEMNNDSPNTPLNQQVCFLGFDILIGLKIPPWRNHAWTANQVLLTNNLGLINS